MYILNVNTLLMERFFDGDLTSNDATEQYENRLERLKSDEVIVVGYDDQLDTLRNRFAGIREAEATL